MVCLKYVSPIYRSATLAGETRHGGRVEGVPWGCYRQRKRESYWIQVRGEFTEHKTGLVWVQIWLSRLHRLAERNDTTDQCDPSPVPGDDNTHELSANLVEADYNSDDNSMRRGLTGNGCAISHSDVNRPSKRRGVGNLQPLHFAPQFIQQPDTLLSSLTIYRKLSLRQIDYMNWRLVI